MMDRIAERIRMGQEDAKMLAAIDQASLDALAQAIVDAKRIYVAGWGRAGNCVKILGMNCSQMGLTAHICGDNTTPSIHEGDLLVVGSGSGETKTIALLAHKAKEHGAKLALISRNANSTIGKIADINVEIPGVEKPQDAPAGTGGSFYHVMVQTVDMVRGYVCEMIGVTSADMHYNHNNLE